MRMQQWRICEAMHGRSRILVAAVAAGIHPLPLLVLDLASTSTVAGIPAEERAAPTSTQPDLGSDLAVWPAAAFDRGHAGENRILVLLRYIMGCIFFRFSAVGSLQNRMGVIAGPPPVTAAPFQTW
eukprot:COSAG01_NODE_21006_length_922_cov_12.601458_2_plen_125_part_01